jgi:hypothetical protein
VDFTGISGEKSVTVRVDGDDLPSRQSGFEYVVLVGEGDAFATNPVAYTLTDGSGGSCEQADAACSATVDLEDDDYLTIGAGQRVVNFTATSGSAFENTSATPNASAVAKLSLPYPASGPDVTVDFTAEGDLDGSGTIEDGGTSNASGSNANGVFEADDADDGDGGTDDDFSTTPSGPTGQITISAGTNAGEAAIDVSLTNDGITEQTERFEIQIDQVSGGPALGTDDTLVFDINDDDNPRDLQFADADYTDGTDNDPNNSPTSTEGSGGGSRTETFTVRLKQDGDGETAASSPPLTSAKFTVTDASTATFGTDLSDPVIDAKIVDEGTSAGQQERLSATTGRLYFADGARNAQLKLEINEDDIDDAASETIELELSRPTSAGLAGAKTTTTFAINDDDAPPTVRFASASSSVSEESGGTSTSETVTVELTARAGQEITVDVALDTETSTDPEQTTATLGSDFTASPSVPTTLSFAPGETSKSLAVETIADAESELDEAIVLDLQNPSPVASSSPDSRTITILDNDAPPVGATGPGGVGTTDGTGALTVWLSGGRGLTRSGGAVEKWADQSGNGFVFENNGPTIDPADVSLNGVTVPSFDGTDWLAETLTKSIIPETDYTQFIVFQTQNSDSDGTVSVVTGSESPTAGANDRNFGPQSGKLRHRIFGGNSTVSSGSGFAANDPHVGAIQVEKNDGQRLFADGPEVAFNAKDESDFGSGSVLLLGNHDNFGALEGRIGEVVLYNRVLGTARRTIVQNALAAKFGATLTSGDRYAGDLGPDGIQGSGDDYDRGVFGIGAESSSDFHSAAQAGGLRFEVENGLDGGSDPNAVDGDYLLAGHKTPSNTVNVSDISGLTSPSLDARMERAWYVDETDSGTGLTVDVTFDLSEAGLAGPASNKSNYVLLSRDPSSTDWTAAQNGANGISNGDEITFQSVNLTQGTEITLGTTSTAASPLDTGALVVNGSEGANGVDQGWRYLGFPKTTPTAGAPPEAQDLRRADGSQFIDFSVDMAYRNNGEEAGASGTGDNGTGGSPNANSNFDGSGFSALNKTSALPPGRGFIVWLFDNERYPVDPSVTLRTADALSRAAGNQNVTVGDGQGVDGKSVGGDPALSKNKELFLLANPYAVPFDLRELGDPGNDDFSTVVQIWEPDADKNSNDVSGRDDANVGSFVMKDRTDDNDGDQKIAPWQGFLLTRTNDDETGEETITFGKEGRLTGSSGVPFVGSKSGTKEANSERRIALEVVGRSADSAVVGLDRAASVVFRDGASPGRDSYDAPKIAPMGNGPALSPVAITPTDTSLRAQESRPLPERETTVPLLFRPGGQASRYTIRVPEWQSVPGDWTVEVVDTKGTATPSDDQTHQLRPEGEGYSFAILDGQDAGGTQSAAKKTSQETTDSTLTPRPRFGRLKWAPQSDASARARSAESAQSSGSKASGKKEPMTRFRLRVQPGQKALPVELAGFEVRAGRRTATLTWNTASETANAGFVVQHQRLGGAESDTTVSATAWEKLGFVEGAGTTAEPQRYRFETEKLKVGRHTFRLRQVDSDGTAHPTEARQVTLRLEKDYVVTPPHPNPTRGRTALALTVRKKQRVTIQIYDALGREVATAYQGVFGASEPRTIRLPVRRLSSGAYFVRIDGDHFRATTRMTVLR